MHMRSRIRLLTLSAALVFSGAAGASAWTGTYYELTDQNSQAGNVTLGPAWVSSATGAPVSTTQLIGTASMFAYASPGILKASIWNAVSVQSQPGIGVSDYSTSHAVAAFNDQVTLAPTNAALIGQTVTVNGSFLLSGDMLGVYNVSGNNSRYFNVYANTYLSVMGTGITGSVQARDLQGYDGIYGVTNIRNPAPAVIPVSFTAVLGSATSIQYNLDLQGYASASFGFRECGGGYGPCGALASAELTADYAHSMLWGGISSVTDANGNPISLTSALGQTGFDYANAAVVPVPAAAGLLGSGLIGLLGAVRKRKH